MHLLTRQGGLGVVAVSPRYAEQMATKLSVFWPLASTPFRKKRIWGILNALDMTNSFASSGLSVDEASPPSRSVCMILHVRPPGLHPPNSHAGAFAGVCRGKAAPAVGDNGKLGR